MHIKNFDPFDFKKKIINNVPVYYKNIPWAPCIHINIVFNTGALADEVGKEGTAHFLEHMTLKGSPRLPSKRDFWNWSKKYTFNTANATTGYNYIYYVAKCIKKDYERVMLDIKDMLFNSYFKDEDVEGERKIITQEAWRRFINDKNLEFKKDSAKNIFNNHPYERFSGSLGWPDTIQNITRQDLINYHKKNFGVGNFHIILVGDIESKEISFLNKFVKDLPILSKKTLKRKYKVNNPLENIIIKRSDEIGTESRQLSIGISVTKELVSENKRWIFVIARLLFQEILFERFRTEHNLCYSVNTYTDADKHSFSFGVNLKTEEKNIDLIKTEFKNLLKEFKTDKFKEKFIDTKTLIYETNKTKEYISGSIIEHARFSINIFGKVFSVKEESETLKKVSFKDIQKFIKEMFADEKKVYTEIILPSKKEVETKEKNAKK